MSHAIVPADMRGRHHNSRNNTSRIAFTFLIIATLSLLGILSAEHARAAIAKTGSGYRIVAQDGTVNEYGHNHIVTPGRAKLRGPVVGIASTPTTKGYWMVATDGGVFGYGDAHFYGSPARQRLAAPAVNIARTPTGHGYWVAAADGGVFGYGDARYSGSATHVHLRAPIVGIANTPAGHGYWLAAADGGVFGYGNARFYGSATHVRLRVPILGIAATPSGHGYWLAAADGGVFGYGDAAYYGSATHVSLRAPIVGIAATTTGHGYWLIGADRGVFAFGDAPFYGSPVPKLAALPRSAAIPVYGDGSSGYDISWPQCGRPNPSEPFSFAVVGVNNGHMYSQNPCLSEQARWAGSRLSLYVNVDGLPRDATSGRDGPQGHCAVNDLLCRSYNYGWNSVTYSDNIVKRLGIKAPMWWLDVEVEPIWRAENPASNATIIEGVVDSLRARKHQVGIYSTSYQWGVITGGGYRPSTPIWVAGASTADGARAYCDPGHAFGGGSTWLSQWTTDFDHDVACPRASRSAR